MFKRLSSLFIPLTAIVLGLLAGAVIMLLSGYDVISGYSALWNGIFGEAYYIGETVRQITPYILSGLAVAFAFRTGLFNIGVEGQLLAGWTAAVWVGAAVEAPMFIHLPLAVCAAALAGALWGFIPGILKARFYVHEVIVTIMMNYIALHVTNYLIMSVMTDHKDKTEKISETASLRSDFLEKITDFSRLHWGIVIALIAAVIMWIIIQKTTKGFELRAVGFNQHASEYAGMSVKKNIVMSMVISGAFAGMAGAMEGLGTFEYASVKGAFTGVGFDGIAVALLGGNTALGVVLSACLLGGLKVGALNMPIEAGVPTEVVDIVIAIIILFVASHYIIRLMIQKLGSKGGK
ncbi:ABC transporter permease [Bacillus sonorensis]|uniref:Sugar ABC transporter n=2 Tax=Bacillus sonorensis TaxID=119858 RepID=M5PCJ6_9BACI|nr:MULTISPECIES: ABC transporter permease [Bacillus]TWK75650.1 D-allose transport system permease protein AlsC [Bacillus paralicheniformis]ASB90559.1 putative ABC transporter permease protein YufP [Bacillus sonorensis]EME72962.1 sugar ABC transporter [Bacillus sonorensis L12]MCZ0073218.1 ABC transporter permease [Bacillus sonorensis]MCZ0091840.1 ABC transporter permease [Bacillus sonorensis]